MTLPDLPIAIGFTAQIYAWKENQVLKLFNAGTSLSTVESEARLTRMVHATGLPVPAVGEIHEIDGRFGLEYERLEGVSMLQALMQKPWKYPTYARQLAELQVSLHQYHLPEMPSQREQLERKILHTEMLPDTLRQVILQKLGSLPEDDRLCHGDYHPGNILLTPHGPVIIDWIDGTRGSPILDIARSTLLMGGGSLPPGTPMPWLVKPFRRLAYNTYMRRYFQLNPIDRHQVSEWLPVAAAARLDEGITYDESRLLSFARAIQLD